MRKFLLLLVGVSAFASAATPADIKIIRERFSKFLKDPLSTQMEILKEPTGKTCGRYNAKNSYGGYVGFKYFVYLKNSKSLYTAGAEVLADGTVNLGSASIPAGLSVEQLLLMKKKREALLARTLVAFEGCE